MIRRLAFLFAVLVLLASAAAEAKQRWLVVSDLHVNPFDTSAAPAPYGRDSNWALVDAVIARMRQTDSNAPVVLVTGDLLAHKFAQKVRAAGVRESVSRAALSTMSQIEKRFAQAFPKARFVVVLGNNDDPCGDYRSGMSTPYLAALAKIWAPLVNRRGAAPGFLRDYASEGAYTAALPNLPLRVVALDDVFWSFRYRNSCGRAQPHPGSAEFAWFERQLRTTPQGVRNLVVMHIPPGVDPISTLFVRRFLVVPFLSRSANVRFLRDVTDPASRVAAVLAAHMHRNDFRVSGNVPILVVPSVSPVYRNNPSFLTLEMRSSGTIADYHMHEFDLAAGSWKIFDFDRPFGVTNFDAPALRAAHRRLAANRTLRWRWSSAFVAGSAKREVTSANWRAFWCAQVHLRRAGYAACAGDRKRLLLFPIALALAILAALGAGAFFLMRLARQRRAG